MVGLALTNQVKFLRRESKMTDAFFISPQSFHRYNGVIVARLHQEEKREVFLPSSSTRFLFISLEKSCTFAHCWDTIGVVNVTLAPLFPRRCQE
jgi:hypothetical protein